MGVTLKNNFKLMFELQSKLFPAILIKFSTGVAHRSEVDVFSSVSVCLFVNTMISERLNIG